MRPKQLKLVVAFDSTAGAIAFEAAAPQNSLTGRLFPVPTSITAGCGLAWQEEIAHREQVEALLQSGTFGQARCFELVV